MFDSQCGAAVLCTERREDTLHTDEPVDCAHVARGLVVLGLSCGKVAGVAGPHHALLFRFNCGPTVSMGGDRGVQSAKIVRYIEQREVVATAEGPRQAVTQVVLYYFAHRGFRGSLRRQVLPTAGPEVTDLSVCLYTGRLAICKGSVVSVYEIDPPSPEGWCPLLAPKPLVELHSGVHLSAVSVCRGLVAYAGGCDAWCVDFDAPAAHAPAGAPEQTLSSGPTNAEGSDAFVEVRLGEVVERSGGERDENVQKRWFSSLRGTRPPPDDAPPRTRAEVIMAELSGDVNPSGQWAAQGEALHIGPVLLTDHRALYTTEPPHRTQCKLLLRQRLRSGDGTIQHLGLLHSGKGGGARFLAVASRSAVLRDAATGRLLAEYTFGGEAVAATSSPLFLFAMVASGTVEVFPLRLEHPSDGARELRAPLPLAPPPLQRYETGLTGVTSLGCGCGGLVVICCQRQEESARPSPQPSPVASPTSRASPTGSLGPKTHLSFASEAVSHSSRTSSLRPGRWSASVPIPPACISALPRCRVVRLAPMAEVFQGFTRRAAQQQLLSSAGTEASPAETLREALQLLRAHMMHLELLQGPTPPRPADSAALSVSLELANARALHAAAATLVTDTRRRRRGGPRRWDAASHEEGLSRRSGGSTLDVVSESRHSLPGSQGLTSAGGTWDADALSACAALAAHGGDSTRESESFGSLWAVAAHADRTVRQVVSTLRGESAALISYLDEVLFASCRPPELGGDAGLVSEDVGNNILRLYAKHKPSRLCAVIWESWLGRARGGAACFSATLAAELLVAQRQRRVGVEKPAEGTGGEAERWEESDEDDRMESSVRNWLPSPPLEAFVIGLLLLEQGDTGGCADSWAQVDAAELAALVASSRHLWEPDVRAPAAPERWDGEVLPGDATVGEVLAARRPAAFIVAAEEARVRFGFPVGTTLRLLDLAQPKLGLLSVRFLAAVAAEDLPDAGSLGKGGERRVHGRAGGRDEGSTLLAQAVWRLLLAAERVESVDTLPHVPVIQSADMSVLDAGGEEVLATQRPQWMVELEGPEVGTGGMSELFLHGLRGGPDASIASRRYLSAVLGGLAAARPRLVAAALGDSVREGTPPPGALGASLLCLLHADRTEQAAVVATEGVTPSRLAKLCSNLHDTRRGMLWEPVVRRLLEREDPAVRLVLAEAATRLPLRDILGMLPAEGSVRFFL
eukprot:Hpha_TRINITY_DN14146_c0_g5::TRINITY_DN14146_c0_g5_i1::g.11033::m.11033